MGRKKEDPDTALAKKYISTALLLLMEQHDYQSITITDIAKKAGVSRMTYYRAYSSKEDILIQYFNEIADDFFKELESRPDVTLYQLAVLFFTFFQENRNLIPTLNKANLLELAFRNFIKDLRIRYTNILKTQKLTPATDYAICFNVGGLAAVLIYWSENGYRETPEQMAQIITPCMTPQTIDSSSDRSIS